MPAAIITTDDLHEFKLELFERNTGNPIGKGRGGKEQNMAPLKGCHETAKDQPWYAPEP